MVKLNAGSGAASAGVGAEDRQHLEDFILSWATDEAAHVFEIWFGEVTPYPNAGLVRIEPESYDRHLAALWLEALGQGGTYPTPERQFGHP